MYLFDPPRLPPGLDFEVGLGKRFTRRIAAEVSVGHYSSSERHTVWLFTRSHVQEYDLGVTSFAATLRFLLLPDDRVRVYGLAGVGLYDSKLDFKHTNEAGVVDSESSMKKTPAGFHLGAGLDFAIVPSLRIGAELKYAFVGGKYQAPGDTTEFGAGVLRAAAALQYEF